MLPEFELYEPKTVSEACLLKKELHAPVLAGGTDVLVAMHGGALRPAALIDIKGLAELQGVRQTPERLELGALTSHRTIEEGEIYRSRFTALYEGCSQVGSPQIRYRGTLGGNLCNAVPSADSIGPLLVFDAVCVLVSPEGEREVPLCSFFLGPKKTVLREDELLARIALPQPAPHTGSCYIKYTRRRAMDLALCGCSVLVTLEGDTIAAARVSLTTSAPTPMRARNAEDYLTGRAAADADPAVLGEIASAEARPRSSWRSSAEFRVELLKELAGRAYRKALARAKGESI